MMEAHKQAKSEADKQREERSESTRDRAERSSEDAKPEAKREEGKPAPGEDKLGKRARKAKNNVRNLRMERMMSKAELARRAEVSTPTVDRVERGMPCGMDTK